MKVTLLITVLIGLGFTCQAQDKAKSIERGKQVYTTLCIACHQADGKGLPGAFPPLAKSDYLLEDIDRAIHAVKYGLQGEIEVNGIKYNSVMVSQQLSDEEVADVLNYVLNSWGNKGDHVTVARVQSVKE
jgi:nitrite reductase (NO-forming)